MSSVILRPATAADVAAVVAMERACYSDPWPASSFNALHSSDRIFFHVAWDAQTDTLVGFAVAWYVMNEGELANLAVDSARRGVGLGRRLLGAVLADAKARGIADLYLEVRESNSAAKRLYAGGNFVEVGRRKRYYRSPVEDALILRRTLEPWLIRVRGRVKRKSLRRNRLVV